MDDSDGIEKKTSRRDALHVATLIAVIGFVILATVLITGDTYASP